MSAPERLGAHTRNFTSPNAPQVRPCECAPPKGGAHGRTRSPTFLPSAPGDLGRTLGARGRTTRNMWLTRYPDGRTTRCIGGSALRNECVELGQEERLNDALGGAAHLPYTVRRKPSNLGPLLRRKGWGRQSACQGNACMGGVPVHYSSQSLCRTSHRICTTRVSY